MALSYRTLREMPYLPDYAQALARWEQTAPIKGRKDDVRPLGKRNQDHHRIERDELSHSITIRRGKPLITYRENGEIVIHGPNWSQKAAEVEIIDEVLGFRGKSFSGMWIECTPDTPDAVTGWYPLRPNAENVFVRADTTTRTPPVFLNPNFPVTHVVKRKEVKVLRERYSPFLTYAKAMSKLRREEPDLSKPTYNHRMQILDHNEYGEAFGWTQFPSSTNRWPSMPTSPAYWNFKTEDADQLAALMRSDDAESNYKAWLWLQPNRNLVSEENLTKYVEKVSMMAHPQDVLTPKVHRDGKMRKDRYAWCLRA